MADLKNFTQDLINTARVDYADTVKGLWSAQAKMVFDGYSNFPVGTVRLTAGLNPNAASASRILQQWAGSSWLNFRLVSNGGFQAPSYSLGQPSSELFSTSETTLLSGAANCYMEFLRTPQQWRWVIDGAERYSITPTQVVTRLPAPQPTTPGAQTQAQRWEQLNANAESVVLTNNRSASGSDWTTNIPVLQREVDVTKMGALKFVGQDVYIAAGTSATTLAVPDVAKFQSSGRVLLGINVPDDGVSSLQSKTLRLTEQPSVRVRFQQGFTPTSNEPLPLQYLLGSGFVQVGNSIVANTSGRYLFVVYDSAVSSSVSPAQGSYTIPIYVNGGLEFAAKVLMLTSSPGQQTTIEQSFILDLAAGDTIGAESRYYGASGTTYLELAIVKLH